MIISIFIQGVQYIVEEKLLGAYYLNPMKVVGWEGMWGCCLFVIVLPILQYIKCDAAICNNGRVENSKVALQQIGESPLLLVYTIIITIGIGGMNGLGMVITKYASAANRVTLSQAKTLIVWVFFLLYPGKGKEKFSWLQLGGFIIMLIGVVLYNEIVSLPFLGFDMYTKAALEKRKLRSKSLNNGDEPDEHLDLNYSDVNSKDATDYAQSSPKPYDYQR